VTTPRMLAAWATGVAVFGLLWELLVRVLDVRAFILLPPSRIVDELAARPRVYVEAAGVTAGHAAVGVLIGLAIAIAAGSVLAASRFVEQAALPVLVLILVAPWVAYFTSIVVWLGRGDPPVIFLVAFVTTPAFVFATVAGLRSADPAARELLASVDASRVEVLWRLRLPAALPTILAAARYSVGLALAASYYGEGGNLTNAGLGAIGRRAANAQNGPALWASVLATVVVGVLGLGVIATVERIALRWHVSQRRALAGWR
jgi:NitT/TauT family transport system permease protein